LDLELASDYARDDCLWRVDVPGTSRSPPLNGLGCRPHDAEGLTLVWVGFRVLGSVLIVPVAEELAFRGYVIHKLVAPDFATVLPGDSLRGLCASCRLSSLACCTAEGWQGPSAGIGYALALRQRGQLVDAVVAHMTTNALIATYVLSQQAWFLWL
jgi:CAAX prenyl protease-like protein